MPSLNGDVFGLGVCDRALPISPPDGPAGDVSESPDTSLPRSAVPVETAAASWGRFPVSRETHQLFRDKTGRKGERTPGKTDGGKEERSLTPEAQRRETSVCGQERTTQDPESGSGDYRGEKENFPNVAAETRSLQSSHDPGGTVPFRRNR
ncbi:hypothetical protein NDU88_005916 [Pleurodeles waltl]|uniref:Uncharacterized protein n=1 Tax=Pleurodeles waltl TaxID=8319 RepID=A0AAV7SNA7_PLEWA|nr:hypothetical protein NDU88_005916 [Pleurodeles waltl]